ncbi:hypothetical protein NHQ30_000631 [Ciborinia camelliae]|nr:hypothetical protein NHQ30_000631 [Ciborinia camelliae]
MTLLYHFGVFPKWISFFGRALEAPMIFPSDGPSAPVRIRKRGTPISGPLSDMLGETVLFCLDFALNRRTNGARLYRLHDDLWFWGSSSVCVAGWTVMQEFATLMGLSFSRIQNQLFSKTGGSVTSTLKHMLHTRFHIENIPGGYLYFPVSMGGLGLKSTFVPLHLIRDQIKKNPDEFMDDFFDEERFAYKIAKRKYENGTVDRG